MKAFWISLILFSLLLVGILGNVYYIHQSERTLADLVTRLDTPEEREELLLALESFWEKNRDLFGLSVGFRELDQFEALLTELRWAYEARDEAEFQRSRALLLDSIEEITRNEKISMGNIF